MESADGNEKVIITPVWQEIPGEKMTEIQEKFRKSELEIKRSPSDYLVTNHAVFYSPDIQSDALTHYNYLEKALSSYQEKNGDPGIRVGICDTNLNDRQIRMLYFALKDPTPYDREHGGILKVFNCRDDIVALANTQLKKDGLTTIPLDSLRKN